MTWSNGSYKGWLIGGDSVLSLFVLGLTQTYFISYIHYSRQTG